MTIDDYIAVNNLLFRYCDYLDRGEMDKMAALFTQATVYLGAADEPIVRDPQRIEAMYRDYVKLYPDGTPRTQHVTTNVIVEPCGTDQIKTQSYVTVFQSTEHTSLQAIIGGRNLDIFSRHQGQWCFTERRIENDMWGDLRAHLTKAFGPHA